MLKNLNRLCKWNVTHCYYCQNKRKQSEKANRKRDNIHIHSGEEEEEEGEEGEERAQKSKRCKLRACDFTFPLYATQTFFFVFSSLSCLTFTFICEKIFIFRSHFRYRRCGCRLFILCRFGGLSLYSMYRSIVESVVIY